jgi:hypothetical protein
MMRATDISSTSAMCMLKLHSAVSTLIAMEAQRERAVTLHKWSQVWPALNCPVPKYLRKPALQKLIKERISAYVIYTAATPQ